MNINFEYDEVKGNARLERFTAGKLEKLSDRFDFIVRSDVFFRKENTSEPDTGLTCKIRLSVPGPRLFAEARSGSLQAAVIKAVDELDRQLRRRKDKLKSF